MEESSFYLFNSRNAIYNDIHSAWTIYILLFNDSTFDI